MDESDALLVVERGPAPSLRFALKADQVTIGRSAGNELVMADPEVSRRHARVLRRADGYAVEDIGSTNGTFVNGQRIGHLTLLQDGDTIDLGDTVRLRFVAPVIAPSPIPPAPVDMSERPTEMLAAAPAAMPAWPRPAEQPMPAYVPPAAVAPMNVQPAAPPPPVYPPSYPVAPRRGRGLLIGCGLLIALLLVCAGTFLILDAYDQGRLLYCGPAQPIIELVLGTARSATCP
ncbi:MAG TPA: FHA domain-containing protein [Promineifilum sp.]|nr:FHA domain-containing protein [Promineifilum sp.]